MAAIALPMAFGSLGLGSGWILAGSVLGGMLDQKFFTKASNTHQEIGKQSDLQMQTASMGSPIITGYGITRVSGNIIWGTKFTEHIHTDSQRVGGKGGHSGGATVTTTTYSYTVSFAVSICAGPIKEVARVWADGTEINIRDVDYTIYMGDEEQQPDPFMEGIEGKGNVPAYRGLAYIVIKNLDIAKFGNRVPSLSFEVKFAENKVTSIIKNVSLDAGIPDEKIMIEGMDTWQVNGFTISGDKTFRSQIEALQAVYPFDGFEYDGKIIFREKGTGTAIDIDSDDLGASETDNKNKDALTVVRTPEIDLPKTVKLAYISKDRDYQDGTASYTRAGTNFANEVSLDTSLLLSDSDAQAIVERRMKEYWANRTTFTFKLPNKYATVQAGSLITLPYNGRRVNALVSNVSYGSPGLSEITADLIYNQTYSSINRIINESGTDIQPPEPTEIRIEVMDIPILPSFAEANKILIAMSAKVYYGADLYCSTDNGVSFSLVKANFCRGVIGNTLSSLGEGNFYTWDEKNTIDVKLFGTSFGGALESRKEIDVLNGANLCVIGNEIVQFKNAVLVAEDTYRLSILLRGRFGTENYIRGHIAGERFVLLAKNNVDTIEISSSDWFKTYIYRYGSSGKSVLDDSFQQSSFTFQAVSSMPLAPCHVEGKRDKSGNITITWVRRARGDGDMKEYVDVP